MYVCMYARTCSFTDHMSIIDLFFIQYILTVPNAHLYNLFVLHTGYPQRSHPLISPEKRPTVPNSDPFVSMPGGQSYPRSAG